MKYVKILILTVYSLSYSFSAYSQDIFSEVMDKPVEGVCDIDRVYFFLMTPESKKYDELKEPKCPYTKEKLEKKLNQLSFLKQNSEYEDKGKLKIIISCLGDVALCEMRTKTKSEQLDQEIVSFFSIHYGVGTCENEKWVS